MRNNTLRTVLLSVALLSVLALTGQSCTIFSSPAPADGGVFRSDDQGNTWTQKAFIGVVEKKTVSIADTSAGVMVFHPTDPNTIYFGTRGRGLYRTEDAGERWQVTGRQDGDILALAIDPEEPEVLYAGYGPHLEKSFDGGITWQRVYTESRGGLYISSIVIRPDDADHIYATNSGGVVLESLDRGETWHVLHIFQGSIREMRMHPLRPDILFTILNDKYMFRSDDAGATWASLQEGLMDYNGAQTIRWIGFDFTNVSRMYIATHYGLLRSDNLGQDWETVQTLVPNNTLVIRTVTVDPQNAAHIYFTTENKLHISKDAGTTWEVETIPTNRLLTQYYIHPDRNDQHFIGTFFVEQ